MASGLAPAQMTALVEALRASSDATVVAALSEANAGALAGWLNANSATKAWVVEASKRDLFEAMRLTTYDSVSAGKKDSWNLMLDLAPIDFTRQQMRKAVLDIFGTTDGNGMLADLCEWASRAEEILGGNSATTGTVTAIKRAWVGDVESRELRAAFGWG